MTTTAVQPQTARGHPAKSGLRNTGPSTTMSNGIDLITTVATAIASATISWLVTSYFAQRKLHEFMNDVQTSVNGYLGAAAHDMGKTVSLEMNDTLENITMAMRGSFIRFVTQAMKQSGAADENSEITAEKAFNEFSEEFYDRFAVLQSARTTNSMVVMRFDQRPPYAQGPE